MLVELGGVDPTDPRRSEVAHDIALHIASAAPRWRDAATTCPADVVEKERAVLEELTRNEGKPEQAIPKIVEGRSTASTRTTSCSSRASSASRR